MEAVFYRLADYEDTGLTPERVQELAQAEKDERLAVLPPNDPLTLKKLREMDGEPVWCVSSRGESRWGLVHVYGDSSDEFACYTTEYGRIEGWYYGMDEYGWLAYRRRPEEATDGT